jgi:hypothetical protein
MEKEKNNIPEDFDSETYIKLNVDLKHLSLLEAKMHYNNTGYLENRIYRFNQIPKRFNLQYYINWIKKKNSDKKYDLPFSGFI